MQEVNSEQSFLLCTVLVMTVSSCLNAHSLQILRHIARESHSGQVSTNHVNDSRTFLFLIVTLTLQVLVYLRNYDCCARGDCPRNK